MKLCIRHIITLIIASFISFTANADMSHIASRFSDGHIVDYRYDAGGKRLGAYYLLASDDVFNDGIGVEGGGVSIQELVREWSGEFVYENGELERIMTDNGYWKNGRYWFYIKDWQGNNRVIVGGISDASATSSGGMLNNPTMTLLQAKDVNVYYPYGTRFSDVFATTTDRYQYSGKEFDRMNGLDLYDFHARQYDPVLGRFTTPDPLSEKYYHISPYAYCASNPLRYIDPTGKIIKLVEGLSTEQIYTVMYNLQQLTNDRLVYSTQKDGSVRVKIASLREGNKVNGTNLIRQINSSDKLMTIEIGQENSIIDKNAINGSNGVGSDVRLIFSPEYNPKITTKDKSTGEIKKEDRPSYIGLAHELIHGIRSMLGNAIRTKEKTIHKLPNGIKKLIPVEEAYTIGLDNFNSNQINENVIRKEQGLNERIDY